MVGLGLRGHAVRGDHCLRAFARAGTTGRLVNLCRGQRTQPHALHRHTDSRTRPRGAADLGPGHARILARPARRSWRSGSEPRRVRVAVAPRLSHRRIRRLDFPPANAWSSRSEPPTPGPDSARAARHSCLGRLVAAWCPQREPCSSDGRARIRFSRRRQPSLPHLGWSGDGQHLGRGRAQPVLVGYCRRGCPGASRHAGLCDCARRRRGHCAPDRSGAACRGAAARDIRRRRGHRPYAASLCRRRGANRPARWHASARAATRWRSSRDDRARCWRDAQ